MEIEEIQAGKSYACKFRVRTFVDKDGKAVSTKNLQIGQTVPEGAQPGDYEGFGIISTRDTHKKLVEVVDQNIDNQTWIVGWDACWDVDEVEWVDSEAQ